jgi:hypothetical protein
MVLGLVVELEVRGLMTLRRLECRSASLVIVGVESWLVVRIWGHKYNVCNNTEGIR